MVKILEKTYEQREAELMQRLLNHEEVLSFSSFSRFCESPQHFIRYKLDKKKDSAVLRRGSLVDVLLLTPHEFDEKYQVVENGFPTTENQKKFCEAILSGDDEDQAFAKSYRKGKAEDVYNSMSNYLDYKLGKTQLEPITAQQKKEADKMVAAVLQNDAAKDLLDRIGESQKGITWEFCGFKWRGFIDLIGDNDIADLKNWRDASPYKVGYQIRDRKFTWQIASYNYATGMKKKCFAIVVDPQYNISVTEIEIQTQVKALEEMERKMANFKYCIAADLWHQSYDFWIDGGVYKY